MTPEPSPDIGDKDRLIDEGFGALVEGRFEDALAIAGKLRSLRHSSSFEIEASARWARGERERAVAVLEVGIAKAPMASPLWHWLGTYRSDLGRFDAALEAFAKEAEFEHVPPSANAYNVAVVYERMGRLHDALDVLDRIERPGDEGPSSAHFAELQARLLFELGEMEGSAAAATKAIGAFRAGLDTAVESDDAADDERRRDWSVLARALAVRADARLQSGDRYGAMEDAIEAIDLDPARAPKRALDVLRRADGQKSCTARRLKLLLEGQLPEAEDRYRGFFVNVKVVADDAAEGVDFAKRFVPDTARSTLSVAEATDEGPAGEEWKGVYARSGLFLFDPDAPEEEADG